MQYYEDYKFETNYSDLEPTYAFNQKRLTINKEKINFVVTHGNCSDGFMSATVVYKWLKNKGIDTDNVIFYNAFHGSDFSALPDMMKDKYVLICDFSFGKELFDQMIDATHGNILILDHHKTAVEKLKDIPQEYLVFDMNHSGAFITWTYMFGFEDIPKAVLYVEDNDIWTKALPLTREFTSFIFAVSFTFDAYEKFFDDNYLTNIVFPTGNGMVIKDNVNLSSLSKKAIPSFSCINNRYYFVAELDSAGILRSELGNYILTDVLKSCNFSMIYCHDHFKHSTHISLRSLNDKSDSTEISKLFGGGGHRNASGMALDYIAHHVPGKLIDSHRAYYLLDNLYVIKYDNGLKFIFLNSPTIQTHLSRYLMQERYTGNEKYTHDKNRYSQNLPGYQEGMFCMRNKIDNQELDEYYHGSVVWGYDGSNYFSTICLLNSLVKDFLSNIEALNRDLLTVETEQSPLDNEVKEPISIAKIDTNTFKLTFSSSNLMPKSITRNYNIETVLSKILKDIVLTYNFS